MRLKITLPLLTLLLCTTACGNRGALYLPDAAQDAKQTEADADSTASESAEAGEDAPESEDDANSPNPAPS